MAVIARACLVAALAACGSETVMRPIIDVPVNDPDATATRLDGVMLTVAHAGNPRDVVSHNFARGEPLQLPDAPFGTDLVIHMTGFFGRSEVAYGRTCTMSFSPGDVAPEPHLFFARSPKFGTLAIDPVPRIGGQGIAYEGTAVLIGGKQGPGPGDVVTTVERFDPMTGALATLPYDVKSRDRAVQAVVGTPPRVLVIGGVTQGDGAKLIEVLDVEHVEEIASNDMGRVDLTATSLTDGRVIVIGGNPPGGAPTGEIDEIEQSDAIAVRKLAASLAHPRTGHSATRLGNDVGAPVLIAGGVDAAGAPVAIAELFKPLSNQLASPATFRPEMRIPRRGHLAVRMPDGSVLFIGGVDAAGAPVRSLELFSLDAGFVEVGDLPAGAGLVDFAAATLPDNRILLSGGRLTPGSAPLDGAYIAQLNLLDGSVPVVPTDRLAVPRAGHQALALCDGTVLISGGTTGPAPAERYNPPSTGRR